MGNCSRLGKSSITLKVERSPYYPRNATVTIKTLKDTPQSDDVRFELTEPATVCSKEVKQGQRRLLVSHCVLPGLDPRKELKKDCQDLTYILESSHATLFALHDGHGTYGKRVVDCCKEAATEYFSQYEPAQRTDPAAFLSQLTYHLDKEVNRNNRLDSSYSGTTEVLVYMKDNSLHCASVGDSRVVLATVTTPHDQATSELVSVQLTRDQKPEDPEEEQRIVQSGGRVLRGVDNFGQEIGPYRVWEVCSNHPGLAMSRSIGDRVGHQIGIISTPVVTEHILDPANDLFFVLASDGVWDVLSNDEAVTFIQEYRLQARRNVQAAPYTELVSCANACIAQLLCEEARRRWFQIVEDEDVVIDDISCMVVELQQSSDDRLSVVMPAAPDEVAPNNAADL